MTSTSRVIHLLGIAWLFVHLIAALPAPPPSPAPSLPKMSNEEKAIYRQLAYSYPTLYNPVRFNPLVVDYYRHLAPSHPQLEQDALQYAYESGKGPYEVRYERKAGYATTIIQGDRGPARAWNLRQVGCEHFDCTFFWRIEPQSVRLLRMDVLPAGIRANEQMAMVEAIRRTRLRLANGDPLSLRNLVKRSQRSTSKG